MTTTVFDGALERRDDGSWQWRDGAPEPRVQDLTLNQCYDFRCRTYGDGACYVEVPRGQAMEQDDLAWVLDGWRAGRYTLGLDGDRTGPRVFASDRRAHIAPGQDPLCGHEPMPERPGPIPRVILVPIADWDARPPCGASWDTAHEDAILTRAYELGWRPSEPYTSRGPRRLEFAP